MRETEYKLNPANINPQKSGKHTILAMNQGKITHAIEVEGGGAGGKDVRSADIAPGKSATFAAPKTAGKYDYICSIHPFMKGSLTVS